MSAHLFNNPDGHRGKSLVSIPMHKLYKLVLMRLEALQNRVRPQQFDADAIVQQLCVEIEKVQGNFPNLEKMGPDPIGTHLASLNLFREADGSLHITIASATGAMAESQCGQHITPHEYVQSLVLQATSKVAAQHVFNMLTSDKTSDFVAAEKFLKDYFPELYAKIGMPDED